MKITDLKFGNVVKLKNDTLCLIHTVGILDKWDEPLSYHLGSIYFLPETALFTNIKTGKVECDLNMFYNLEEEDYSMNVSEDDCDGFNIVEVYEDFTLQKVLWKRPSKENVIPTLTESEEVILKNIPNIYKWIARDVIGRLFVYTVKPEKGNVVWYNPTAEHSDSVNSNKPFEEVALFNHLFTFITWEDEEPYSINKLIKMGVSNNDKKQNI